VKEGSVPTARELADQFLCDVATRLNPNTVRIDTNDLNSFCGAVGTLPADELTLLQVSRRLTSLNCRADEKAVGELIGKGRFALDRRDEREVSGPRRCPPPHDGQETPQTGTY
jgi:hypothetical protein